MLVALTEAAVSGRDRAHARIAAALADDGRAGRIAGQAYLVHARNSDDAYAVASHPGSAVVPVALDEASARGAGGGELLASVVAGYETACLLADVFLPRAAERGWRITSVIAPVAAAATLASFGLDEPEAVSALRIAAATIGGPLETVSGRGEDFRAQPAFAAAQGVLATRAATGGLVGTTGILEGPQGPFALICGQPWPGWPVGGGPRIHHVTFKRYEGAMYAQAIFAALEQLPPLSGEVTVELRVPAFAVGYSERGASNDRAPSSLTGSTLDALARLHPGARASSVRATADDAVGRFGAAVTIALPDGSVVAATGDSDTSGWMSDEVDALCRSRLGDDSLVAAVRALDGGGSVETLAEVWREVAGRPWG